MQAVAQLLKLYEHTNPDSPFGDLVYLCCQIEQAWKDVGLSAGETYASEVTASKEYKELASVPAHEIEESLHIFLGVVIDFYEHQADAPTRKERILVYRRLIRLFEKCGVDTSGYLGVCGCFDVAYREERPNDVALSSEKVD